MGKLNVTILRYLTKEDFRVLTAVSRTSEICVVVWLIFTITNGPFVIDLSFFVCS